MLSPQEQQQEELDAEPGLWKVAQPVMACSMGPCSRELL